MTVVDAADLAAECHSGHEDGLVLISHTLLNRLIEVFNDIRDILDGSDCG